MSLRLVRCFVLAALAAGTTTAWAQKGIYTCVDAKGRRLTSDRPIPECLDREQKELNATGTVRRNMGPVLTPLEQAAQDERNRKLAEEQQRANEEKRRERALLSRYPTQSAHDLERTKALNAVQDVIAAANKRTEDLREERRRLDVEMEFYKSDPSKMPGKLRQRIDEVESNIAGQARFLANQEEEKRRVNARFDQELARLKVLWAQMRAGQAPAATAQPARY